jgi:hypothetical protein
MGLKHEFICWRCGNMAERPFKLVYILMTPLCIKCDTQVVNKINKEKRAKLKLAKKLINTRKDT